MNKIYTILTLLSFSIVSTAQIKLFEPTHPNTNLNNTTINVTGSPSDQVLDYYLSTVNEGTTPINISIRRTELSVMDLTKNATCWEVCPSPIFAGTEVVQISAFSATIAATDTNDSFSAHMYPENIDGCSSFLYEWIDANDNSNVLGTVTINYYHSAGNCTVGITDYSSPELSLSPNPANENVNLSISYVGNNTTVEIINLLGQNVYSTTLNSEYTSINTSTLPEGIYIVTTSTNGTAFSTEKLVIKH